MEFWRELKRGFSKTTNVIQMYIENNVRELSRVFWISRNRMPNNDEYDYIVDQFSKFYFKVNSFQIKLNIRIC